MINCIAVDDEPLALEVIKTHCEKIKSVNLKKTFLSSIEAVEYIKENPVDLIFLDINMPEINGINFRKFIPAHIQIVFITAYQEHALASYRVGATDYLLKPVSLDQMYQVVDKCIEKKSKTNTIVNTNESATILVKSDKKVVQILVNEILYIEGLKDYAKIYYSNGQKEVIRESLKKIMEVLELHGFLRVHRSYIVPINKIRSFSGNVIYIADVEIPISKSFRNDLIAIFKEKGILGDRSEQ